MRIKTARLTIRPLTLADASFMLELASDPEWLRYIGDRGIHDLASARNWIESGPMTSCREHGFGLHRVGLGHDDTPIGICGLLQRDGRVGPELGFALLPAFRGLGYAREAAEAIIEQTRRDNLGLSPIYAIVTPDNLTSKALLDRLGFVPDGDAFADSGASSLERYRIEI